MLNFLVNDIPYFIQEAYICNFANDNYYVEPG